MTSGGLLFLCVANSARSQMAEGLARALVGESIRVQSAGSRPAQLHPLAVQALAEIGVDISGQIAKSVEEVDGEAVGTVITLCAEEVCPVYLASASRLHWPLPDPAAHDEDNAEGLEKFRAVRDDLARRIGELLAGERK